MVAALTRISIEEIEQFLCTAAGLTRAGYSPSAAKPRLGAVSFAHCFGSVFNHHAHLLACATDGGFVPTGDGPSAFLPARLITQADLATLTEKVGLRVVRSFRMQRLIEGLNRRREPVVGELKAVAPGHREVRSIRRGDGLDGPRIDTISRMSES